MVDSFAENEATIRENNIYIFGHCEASLCLADFLIEKNVIPKAILDNNNQKHGIIYKNIPVIPVEDIMKNADNAAVLIVTRFYESMNRQLRDLGFDGPVIKLIDYNTYAEYSLSPDTIERKTKRLNHGIETLNSLKKEYKNELLVFCPFNALGDIYFCMSYLSIFASKRGFDSTAVFVPSEACAKVVELFSNTKVKVIQQKELDATIQAVIYTEDQRCYIAHQDRPYVINLHKALYIKCIPLETIYCCGVFGLPKDTKPIIPDKWEKYPLLDNIPKGKSAIISPYAKSVTALSYEVWKEIVSDLISKGYTVYTNVVGNENALEGTIPISPAINEMKSVVEQAGLFIGIRSGLCDVIRTADCRKIALYPDYYYSDTKWKAIDMYAIDTFENIVVEEDFKWELN
jgi:hypothetical protein